MKLLFIKSQGGVLIPADAECIENMQKVVDTFGQPLNYFSISRRQGFTNKTILPNKYIGPEEQLE